MCTAATYKTKDFYFGRTLDYEFSYGDEIAVMPRKYPLSFRHIPKSGEQPEVEQPEKIGLSGGAIAGIAVGSVIVVGLGGFSLFWFVIKKKKFADLIALFKKK